MRMYAATVRVLSRLRFARVCMHALMMEVIKLKRACHCHGMLIRMYQKKTAINY